jgi:hypothetical protein
MVNKDVIRTITNENTILQDNKSRIKRECEININSNLIIVISGIRRCGKSTLLLQGLKDIETKMVLNFEDTRLTGFENTDFLKVEKIAESLNTKYMVFDEIQNLNEWEKYIRSAHDKGYKIYITGSNASLLSRELGTKLTGRYKQTELFPFNFNEYLLYLNVSANPQTFQDYLQKGGFPEALQSSDAEYLRTLLRDIVVRDIAVRRNIKNDTLLLRLALNLVSNIGKEISFNNLTNTLSIKSVRSTIDYCDYLKESYLFDFIPRFSFSIKQQLNNPKKVYCIDTGMAKANSLSMSEDYGRMLENAVFLKLRSYTPDIMFFSDNQSECDFLVRRNEDILFAVQVCWLLNSENLKRELTGLQNAMNTTHAPKGIIVTFDQEDTFGDIKVVPAWKWLCEDIEL